MNGSGKGLLGIAMYAGIGLLDLGLLEQFYQMIV